MPFARALVYACILALSAVSAGAATPAAPQPATSGDTPAARFPQQRSVDGYALTLHAPQVRSWPEFQRFTATFAFELTAPGESTPKFGTASLSGATVVDRPTELIVTDGKPSLETIAGTDGLQWVQNTESPLFKLGSNWYFLVAGRWFTTANLDSGAWTYTRELPQSFSKIPRDHARAAVLASVPGTIEARTAALEASLPTKTRVKKGSAPTVEVTYAGDPKFEPIPGTPVARAVNTGFDVLMYQNRFYLVYAAAWYVADAPSGPWGATDDVPAAMYAIPPSSPAYAVTDVKPAKSTGDDDIESSSTQACAAGVIVAMGVAYYGTGWYGPYGGYSYTQGYNPRSGRYGYVETAWDGDEWVKTERKTDFDDGTQTIERETSQGGSSEVERSREGGSIASERTITGEQGSMTTETRRNDGRSATSIEGSGSGDPYAGHDGNVYKKTDDGWQHYDNGEWASADTSRTRAQQRTTAAQAPARTESWDPPASSTRDTSQLNRDYSARQRGNQPFQQRSGGMQRSGMGRRR